MATTIRVSNATRDRFARLSDATGKPMTDLLDEAVDALERRVFFERFTARYDELRADPAVWAQIAAERTVEAGTLADRPE